MPEEAPRKKATRTTASGRAVRPAKGEAVAGDAKPLKVIEGGSKGGTEGGAVKGATLRKKELIERVVLASGGKKKAVKDIVEATLKVLGDALAADETLALPPFGKAKVNKHKGLSSGEMLVVKLRRGGAPKAVPDAGKDALAEDDE